MSNRRTEGKTPPASNPKTPGGAGEQPTKTPPLPDNPYHRIYTKNNSFEELVRRNRKPAEPKIKTGV